MVLPGISLSLRESAKSADCLVRSRCRLLRSALLPGAFLTICFLSVYSAWAADKRKVVIPFDFVSKFDHGHCGEMLGEQIWMKLPASRGLSRWNRSRTSATPAQNNVHPSPEMPIGDVGKIVVRDFDAQIGIWGSVERAAGHDEEVYDLVIKCVDFSDPKQPKTIYQCNARTKTVSEIPHLYVRQLLDALAGRSPAGLPGVDPLAKENWKKNPNLVIGGDFQSGSRGVPGVGNRSPGSRASRWANWSAGSRKPAIRKIS